MPSLKIELNNRNSLEWNTTIGGPYWIPTRLERIVDWPWVTRQFFWLKMRFGVTYKSTKPDEVKDGTA
jgi:hypothetical protein